MFRTLKPGRHVFTTAQGAVGLAWTELGIDHFELPDRNTEALAARLEQSAVNRPFFKRAPSQLQKFVKRVKAHLDGRPDDFRDVPLDLTSLTPFARKVSTALCQVGPGSTVTYGELARLAGSPKASQAVGRVMGANPVPLLVPCHRVLRAGQGLGGFSAAGGLRQKEHLLQVEGVVLSESLKKGYDHLARVDRRLGRVIRAMGPYTPGFGGGEDPWQILVTSIVHQQLSLKAAGTILGRVIKLTRGKDVPTPRQVRRLTDEQLRGCGLSRGKVSFIRDLAEHVLDGRLDLHSLHKLDDEQVLEVLTAVKGIGVWTAQMALIFHLGRLDIWPTGDLGMRNALQMHLKLAESPDEKATQPLGDKYAPYRSMAAWYLWTVVDGEPV
jgi:DNA-3-methyladenine glycosylase II